LYANRIRCDSVNESGRSDSTLSQAHAYYDWIWYVMEGYALQPLAHQTEYSFFFSANRCISFHGY